MKLIQQLTVMSVLLVTSLSAKANEPFQVKGLRLGETTQEACGSARLTTKIDDLLDKYRAAAPDLIATGTSECHIAADTFGGLKIDGGIDLLFLDRKLIQAKFSFEPMHWMKYAELFAPLEEMYGKPVIEKGEVFTTHTWRQSGATFATSRADTDSGVDSLEIILRDVVQFQAYEDRSEANRVILGRLDSDSTKSDIRD